MVIKKYVCFSVVACVIGTLMATVAISILYRLENFDSLRYLFGIKLYFVPVCLAWLLTVLIGIITLEVYYMRYTRKGILNNVRGDKVA